MQGNKAIFAGGYTQDYEAKSTVFSLQVAADGSLLVMEETPMPTARGDVAAVASETGFGMVVGGFTHENDFCDPLATAEQYVDGVWTETTASLGLPRSDKALVELEGHIFALGGERQIEGVCDIQQLPETWEKTVAVDDVELYDAEKDTWVPLIELPSHRFRFGAIGFDNVEAVYAFGGQLAYDPTCDCFPTTDEVC